MTISLLKIFLLHDLTLFVKKFFYEKALPFADGNGRMGRLWQTLILSEWKSILAYLPVETIIKQHQKDYYQALEKADDLAESTPFIEFILFALQTALQEAVKSERL